MSLIEVTDLWKTYEMGPVEVHALRGVEVGHEWAEGQRPARFPGRDLRLKVGGQGR